MSAKRLPIVPERDWYPQFGAFQIYPRRLPRFARHSILHATEWKRVADEIYRYHKLLPIGNDGARWMYFA